MSTWVLPLGDGRYEIVEGDLDDNDLNIYVGYFDENNTFIKGKSIGETTSITSFYDTDKKEWAKSAIIDSNDLSGLEFLNFIRYETPSLLNYMINARKNQLYDFKSTNAEPNRANLPMYRGMPIGNIHE